jgi:hypothetical protein
LRVQGFRVQGSRVQKKADRLGSHKAGKLVGLKRRKLPGFLASWPSSYELSAMSIFWTQIFADHHRFFILYLQAICYELRAILAFWPPSLNLMSYLNDFISF